MGRMGDGAGLRARGLGRQGRKGVGRGKERGAAVLGCFWGWVGLPFGFWAGLVSLFFLFPFLF